MAFSALHHHMPLFKGGMGGCCPPMKFGATDAAPVHPLSQEGLGFQVAVPQVSSHSGGTLKAQVLFGARKRKSQTTDPEMVDSRFPHEVKTFTEEEAWQRLEALVPQVLRQLAPLDVKAVSLWDEAVFKDYYEAKFLISKLAFGYHQALGEGPDWAKLKQGFSDVTVMMGGLYLNSNSEGDRDGTGEKMQTLFKRLLALKQELPLDIEAKDFPRTARWKFYPNPEYFHLSWIAWD